MQGRERRRNLQPCKAEVGEKRGKIRLVCLHSVAFYVDAHGEVTPVHWLALEPNVMFGSRAQVTCECFKMFQREAVIT